ncbi:exodeoxyribonuclease VII large subunit, partial [Nocardioides sp. NPDC000441]|uniref:exodeoxyribonuclease VII large subunit n=1 Tax=Nocardioides sp. NPDC000441 TaxID=3154256 RepID=UPI003324FCC1
ADAQGDQQDGHRGGPDPHRRCRLLPRLAPGEEQLLAAEGLFAAELKRPLPFLPAKVGLLTAANSAAERDVLENAKRRWPQVRFEVAYAAMQGARSAADVVEKLQRLDRDPEVDVIVIARGGGSVEDLLPFSDEHLIRAVHAARTPVVSAIGHEPDSPLLDLAADVRASTPTDAAKLVVPDVVEEQRIVATGRDRLRGGIAALIHREQTLLDALRSRPVLADPRSLIDARRDEVTSLRDRARRTLGHALDRAADDIGHHRARARALSPLETLRRGYAVAQDADGHVLTSVADAAEGETVSIRLADGRLTTTITSIEKDPADD